MEPLEKGAPPRGGRGRSKGKRTGGPRPRKRHKLLGGGTVWDAAVFKVEKETGEEFHAAMDSTHEDHLTWDTREAGRASWGK